MLDEHLQPAVKVTTGDGHDFEHPEGDSIFTLVVNGQAVERDLSALTINAPNPYGATEELQDQLVYRVTHQEGQADVLNSKEHELLWNS